MARKFWPSSWRVFAAVFRKYSGDDATKKTAEGSSRIVVYLFWVASEGVLKAGVGGNRAIFVRIEARISCAIRRR